MSDYKLHFPILLITNRFSPILQLQIARLNEANVDILTVTEITDMFIEAGIHIDAVNIDGLTAAQLCVTRKFGHQ